MRSVFTAFGVLLILPLIGFGLAALSGSPDWANALDGSRLLRTATILSRSSCRIFEEKAERLLEKGEIEATRRVAKLGVTICGGKALRKVMRELR